MRHFTSFLREEAEEAEGEKLKHIEHLEDHPINDGKKGFEHAVGALTQAHQHIIAGGHDTTLAMKHDGSPSIVYGHHPETGKFFVASKSAFNKNPKINYTPADIIKNHGHAPGLVEKLTHALQHLPKVTPKQGVFQGDVLFSGNDKKKEGDKYKFTPNTITYSAHKDSEEGKKIGPAKFGIYTHTQYVGKSAKSMTANYSPDLEGFKEHKDVYHRYGGHDTSKVKMSGQQYLDFAEHRKKAQAIHDKHGEYMYDALHNPGAHGNLRDHMKTYINSTVDTQEKPSVERLQKHLEKKYNERIDKVKTDASKKKYQDELDSISRSQIQMVALVREAMANATQSLLNADLPTPGLPAITYILPGCNPPNNCLFNLGHLVPNTMRLPSFAFLTSWIDLATASLICLNSLILELSCDPSFGLEFCCCSIFT